MFIYEIVGNKWKAINKLLAIVLFIFILNVIMIYLNKKILNIEISVIIPTFNREKLIIKSIKSVLNQTFKKFEIIIIDDGSTDKTQFVINKFKDKRIRYIKLYKNMGGANARNIGIKTALGTYIAFLDSDDQFYPDKLEKQMSNIINKESDLDFCKMRVFGKSGIYFVPNRRQEKSIIENNIINELISNGNFISTQTILTKKDFINKYYFDTNMPRLQDYELLLRILPKAKISYTNEVLVDLHMQKDSISLSIKKLKKSIDILLKKEFNFNLTQKKLFKNYLNYFLSVVEFKPKNKVKWIANTIIIINIKGTTKNKRYNGKKPII